jgi:predicted dehydrogenase
MTSVYTASVVGAGMGGQLSIKALTTSDRFRLVAVTDLREAVRREVAVQAPGACTFATHQAMFAECPTDVVCIATWPPSHLEVTRAALELPLKGILVEKPLADNTADGRALVDLIRRRNLPLVVPHGLLVAPHSRQIIDRVQSGQIVSTLAFTGSTSWWRLPAMSQPLSSWLPATQRHAPTATGCKSKRRASPTFRCTAVCVWSCTPVITSKPVNPAQAFSSGWSAQWVR